MNAAHPTPLPAVMASIDPITFEVIRHKLEAITEEQAITLKNVSGSPVVTEATDFNVGIYLADGEIVNMGPQVIFHAGTMSTVIYSIIEISATIPGSMRATCSSSTIPIAAPSISPTFRL